jgi:hypothetical protein
MKTTTIKTVKKPPAPSGATLHIVEPERFAAVRKVFAGRNLGALSLGMMVRLALDEWLKEQGK